MFLLVESLLTFVFSVAIVRECKCSMRLEGTNALHLAIVLIVSLLSDETCMHCIIHCTLSGKLLGRNILQREMNVFQCLVIGRPSEHIPLLGHTTWD